MWNNWTTRTTFHTKVRSISRSDQRVCKCCNCTGPVVKISDNFNCSKLAYKHTRDRRYELQLHGFQFKYVIYAEELLIAATTF